MATKRPFRALPGTSAHVRWAVRDLLDGPLAGMKMPETLADGRLDSHAVAELLSSCGIRRGAREFFSRILGNAEGAELVGRHIDKYGEQSGAAAKSLIRIIVANAGKEKQDTEVGAALFSCIRAAETMREKNAELALMFLKFCGSAALGFWQLERISRCCAREEVIETAISIMGLQGVDAESVIWEFFLGMRYISCGIKEEYETEGMLRCFLRSCIEVSAKCPDALYSFIYYYCNPPGEDVEDRLIYMGLFTSPGTMQAFSSLGKNTVRIAELADECFMVGKALLACARDGCDGVEEAARHFSDALGKLCRSWPAAVVPFASYSRMILEARRPERMQMLVDGFTSESSLSALESSNCDPRVQAAIMEACFMAASGSTAN